ncbi:vWA domain-containing protein [Clostridium paraputrificum]|uniref:vWA domain-containing protein n=1 Tax=Clostridium paraputrificum TaxID=29363 RepID=UPI003D342221
MREIILGILKKVKLLSIFFVLGGLLIFIDAILSESTPDILVNNITGDITEYITGNKSAEVVEGRNVKITFNVEQTKEIIKTKGADVILAYNKTGEAEDGTGDIQRFTKGFINEVLDGTNDNRVALIPYCADYGSDQDATDIVPGISSLTSEKNILLEKVDKLFGGGSNNTEAAMHAIANEIKFSKETNPEGQRIVFLFNDGLPTRSNGNEHSTHPYLDENIKKAQKAYNEITGDLQGVGGIALDIDNNYNRTEGKYELLSEDIIPLDEDTLCFSVGFFSKSYDFTWLDPSIEEPEIGEEKCIEYLSTMQNAINMHDERNPENLDERIDQAAHEEALKEYKERYYASNKYELSAKFQNVYEDIIKAIIKPVYLETTITDRLSKDFKFPVNADGTVDYTKLSIEINGRLVSKKEISKYIKSINVETKEIELNLGKLEERTRVSFIVEPEDEYFYGSDIPTNTEAKITASSSALSELPINGGFQSPRINLDPVIGKLSISKKIEEGTILDENQIFNIQISGANGNFRFGLKAGEKLEFDFIMKEKDTNLEFANLSDNRMFINVGEDYTAREVVPLEYIQIDIKANYKGNINDLDWINYTDKIIVDKDHQAINIEVINKSNPVNTWYDYEKVENKLNMIK